jgi:drug/metabolite transporter (DMT)-like permease
LERAIVRNPGLRSKTLLAAAVAVLSNVLGNFALSQGMRHVGTSSISLLSLPALLLNTWVVAGICLLAIWMVTQLSLLSWADLSYVMPVTASSYVLTAVLGAIALGETISAAHWIGIALIFLGVAVVGRTAPRSANLRAGFAR